MLFDKKKTAEVGSAEHYEKNESTLASEDGGVVERASLEKRLVRKLDLRFSILILIYILNYIDRNNVAAARTKGFEEDLGLTGSQYPTILSILYVGYMLMQVPSNMLVQKTGKPSVLIPGAIVIWGAISMLFAVAKNYISALMLRFFLGFVEAAFFPGALFLLSKWYRKEEYGLRTCILYCGSLISNSINGLLAAGILDGMEGKGNLRGWRWLFILEGGVTVIVGIAAYFILPDFPHNTKGLSAEERELAELRMVEDVGSKDIDTTTSMQALLSVVTDVKAWTMALSLTSMVIGLSFNQFFPTLTKSLGYSNTISLVLCAPPFAFAAIMAFIISRHSDKTGERFYHTVGPLLVGIVGFAIAMSTQNTAARFVSLFLMASSYSGFVCLYAWIPSTFPRPAMKRGIAIAGINMTSQLGNIAGAYIFPKQWGPSYRYSYGICIACFGVCIMGLTFHRWNLNRLNKKLAEQDAAGEVNVLDGVELPRGFRYVL